MAGPGRASRRRRAARPGSPCVRRRLRPERPRRRLPRAARPRAGPINHGGADRPAARQPGRSGPRGRPLLFLFPLLPPTCSVTQRPQDGSGNHVQASAGCLPAPPRDVGRGPAMSAPSERPGWSADGKWAQGRSPLPGRPLHAEASPKGARRCHLGAPPTHRTRGCMPPPLLPAPGLLPPGCRPRPRVLRAASSPAGGLHPLPPHPREEGSCPP